MKQRFPHRKAALVAVLAAAGMSLYGLTITAHAADDDTAAQSVPNANPSVPDATAAPAEYVAAQGADQILASDLVGMEARSGAAEDQKLGKISDVLLDSDGDVSTIVVGVGGFLGIGEKDVGMPWDRIQSIDASDKLVYVNATRGELEDAPAFRDQKGQKDESAQPSQNQTAGAAAGYYVLNQDENQILADDLIGMNVENPGDNNKKVGEIADVVVSLDGKADAIVVGVGGFLGMGEKDVGMPWDRIQSVDMDDKVVRVNASKDELEQAPEYNKNEQ